MARVSFSTLQVEAARDGRGDRRALFGLFYDDVPSSSRMTQHHFYDYGVLDRSDP